MKAPIFFLHVPKTAGTSVRLFLQKSFRPERLCFVYPVPIGKSRSDRVDLRTAMQWSADRWSRYDMVYGHFQFGQLSSGFKGPDRMCFLRQPEARIVSWLNHVRRKHDTAYHGVVNDRLGISELIDKHRIRELDNGMVRAIGGFGMLEFGQLDETHLNSAIRNVEGFRFVGFADEMHDSMIRLGQNLGVRPRRPERINTNPDGPAESFLTPSDRKDLKPFCELDQALMDFARKAFRRGRMAS